MQRDTLAVIRIERNFSLAKKNARSDKIDLRLACFMAAYRQSGYTPKEMVDIVSCLPGGENAIVKKAFWLSVS